MIRHRGIARSEVGSRATGSDITRRQQHPRGASLPSGLHRPYPRRQIFIFNRAHDRGAGTLGAGAEPAIRRVERQGPHALRALQTASRQCDMQGGRARRFRPGIHALRAPPTVVDQGAAAGGDPPRAVWGLCTRARRGMALTSRRKVGVAEQGRRPGKSKPVRGVVSVASRVNLALTVAGRKAGGTAARL